MCPENTALRFGKTTADYIQLPKGIMDNSTTRFSLCSWINKQYSGSTNPTVIENKSNFKLGDDGNYYKVTSTNLELRSKYNRTLGTWFHVCMTWSNEDRRTRVYLNGNLIGTSNVTEREELDKEMRMCLGNSVSQSKLPKYVFGGDLFKLNIYNRVLTESEIENMASDICSNEEQELASIKVLSWEDVISHERTGNVSEILMRCGASVCRIEENYLDKSKNKTLDLEIQQDEINAAVLERLQNFEDKLAKSRNKTSNLEEKLTEFQGRLQISEEELAESRNKTSNLEGKLTEFQGRLQTSEDELAESQNKTSQLEEKLTEVLGKL